MYNKIGGNEMNETPNEFTTIRELAERLKVNMETVRRLIKKGELPIYKIGKSVRIRLTDVEEYLKRTRR
jgi:excisionase family DNA binding protein